MPLLILAELLWFLLACPCARFERRGRKRETVFRCTQKTLEALGHAVVLPLVLLAVGFLVLEAMRLDGSESDAPARGPRGKQPVSWVNEMRRPRRSWPGGRRASSGAM